MSAMSAGRPDREGIRDEDGYMTSEAGLVSDRLAVLLNNAWRLVPEDSGAGNKSAMRVQR
jgi:hypothetical protein